MIFTKKETTCIRNFCCGPVRAGLGLSSPPIKKCITGAEAKSFIVETMKKEMCGRTMTHTHVIGGFIDMPDLVDIGLNESTIQIGIWKNRLIFVTHDDFGKDHWKYIIMYRGDYEETQPGIRKIPNPPPKTTHGFRWEKRVLWGVEIEVLVDGFKADSATFIQSYIRRFLAKRKVDILRLDPYNLFDLGYSSKRKEILGIQTHLWNPIK